MALIDKDRLPVIVGVGETTERPEDPCHGRQPHELMADALREADADAGGGWLAKLDSLDIVRSVSWGYRDLPGQVRDTLGIAPARTVLGLGGGERPTYELHQAALAIASGKSEVAAACGGEAQWTVDRATRNGATLPWPADDRATSPRRDRRASLHPVAWKYGLHAPIHVYPLYENATLAAWGQTPAQAHRDAAQLWAAYSAVAATHPHAWLKRAHDADEIGTRTKNNRLIAWPYLKLMTAQASVNFGSAIIVTSFARAKAAGVPEQKMVFFHGGAAADESKQYLERDRYDHSTAQDAVLETLLRQREGMPFDHVELYSCFPTVPKMARRTLGLPAGQAPTVTGGLTFFGGPLNNYMSHAAIAMVRRLRENAGTTGLLYGQGGYVSNHHALVLSGLAPKADLPADFSVQAEAERRRDTVPNIIDTHTGRARIETFTVVYGRDGEPEFATIVARSENNERLMARVPVTDSDTIAFLTHPEVSPVGTWGSCSVDKEGYNLWHL